MTDLIMIVPSRGRPENITRLANAMHNTMTAATRLLVVVDRDDPKLNEYDKALDNPGPWAKLTINYELKGLNTILNCYAVAQAEFCDYVGFMGDDHLPRTKGWDAELIGAIGQRPGVAYANDLFQKQNLPTSVVMSSALVRGLGYMAPPPLQHMYMDNFWKRLGTDLDHMIYMPEVIIEHMHPFAGKAELDAGYQRVNTPRVYDEDRESYEQFLLTQWPADLESLKGYLKND